MSSETETMVGARRSRSRSARARQDDTPKLPTAETMMNTVDATAKTPNVLGSTMRATIAVMPMSKAAGAWFLPCSRRRLAAHSTRVSALGAGSSFNRIR